MNSWKKCAKPTHVLLAIVFLMVSTFYQSASAAMIGTEKLLTAGRHQESRDYLHQLMERQQIKGVLIAQGIDPEEAKQRIESLTDEEIALVAHKLDDLEAGRGVFIFSMIIIGVIVAAFIIFNYTSVTDVFP